MSNANLNVGNPELAGTLPFQYNLTADIKAPDHTRDKKSEAYAYLYNGIRSLAYKSFTSTSKYPTAFAYPEFGLDGDLSFHPDKIQDEHIEMLFLAAGIYQRQVIDVGREHYDLVLRVTLPIDMVEPQIISIREFFTKVDATAAHKSEVTLIYGEQGLAKFFGGIQRVVTGQKPKVQTIRIVVESGTKIKTVLGDLVFLNKHFEEQRKEFHELPFEKQERRQDTIQRTSLSASQASTVNPTILAAPKSDVVPPEVLSTTPPTAQSIIDLKGPKKANGLDYVAHLTPITNDTPRVKPAQLAHQTPISGSTAVKGVIASSKPKDQFNVGGDLSDDALLSRGVQRLYSIFLNTNNRNQKFSQASLINNIEGDDIKLLNRFYGLASFERDLTKTDAAVYLLQLPANTNQKRVEEVEKALIKIMQASTQFGQILDPISLAKDAAKNPLDDSYNVDVRLEDSKKGFWASRSKPKPIMVEITIPNGSKAETVFEAINDLQTVKGIGAQSGHMK